MSRLIVSNHAVGTFPDHWRHCVGSGNMGLALHQRHQETLAIVQEAIGFEFIRGHCVLSDHMGVCRDKYHQTIHTHPTRPFITNFTYVDRVYDSFLEHGIRPMVELSFMPSVLASGNQLQFYYKANVTPPADMARWRQLIREFTRHLVARYDAREVAQWPFEVWNEPDLGSFWPSSAGQAAYFDLYRSTVDEIKQVCAGIRVGGPAVCPGGIEWITPFLEMCHREGAPVDFVSAHSYYGSKHFCAGEFFYQLVHPVEHGLAQFRDARQRINTSPYPALDLYITEYNTSWSPVSPVHDTAFNAAFLARLISEGGDIARSFAYWTFSDVFEEQDVPPAPFHGGFGLVTMDGIPKPTFHLFAFARQLGPVVLHRDNDCLVTRCEDGALAILAWNPVWTIEPGQDRRIEVTLPAGTKGERVVSQWTVDEEHGNAWTAWKRMGRHRYPSRAEIERLREAARPALHISRATVEDGRVKVSLALGPNAVVLCLVEPLADETGDYVGLDDTRVPGMLPARDDRLWK